MTNNPIYNELLKYQSLSFGSLDIRALVDAAIEAGRNNDANNIPVKIVDNENRMFTPIIQVDYFLDDEGKENIEISTDSFTRDFKVDEINYERIRNLLNRTVRDFGDTEIYIDTEYGFKDEQDHLFENNEPPSSGNEQNGGTDNKKQVELEDNNEYPIHINNKRTVIQSEYQVQLNTVAKMLRSQGFDVRTKRGGSLEVTHPDLSPNSRFTVTKKNAYIENAELSTPEAKAIYDKMRADVHQTILSNLTRQQRRDAVIASSQQIAGLSSIDIAKEAIQNVFDKGDTFSIKDKDGNDFIKIERKDIAPEDANYVSYRTFISFGEKYGNYSKELNTEFDKASLYTGNIYFSNTYEQVNDFIKMGLENVEKAHNLNKLNNIEEYFYQLTNEENEVIFDSKAVSPRVYEYDREWMNSLAKMEDKLTDLRNGPIQNAIDISKSIIRGVKETALGIASPYKDGVLSGVDLFKGFSDFRDGLDYTKLVKEMDAKYQELSSSNSEKDRMKAAELKTSITFMKERIHRDANVYFKAAIVMRNKVDQMIGAIQSAKESAMHSKAKQTLDLGYNNSKEFFANCARSVTAAFKDFRDSGVELGKDFVRAAKDLGTYSIDTAKNAQNVIIDNINNVKTQYNDAMLDKNAMLSMQEYTVDQMAGKLNDFLIMRNVKDISTLPKALEKPLWQEMPALIQKAKEAIQTPAEIRTSSEKTIIEKAREAREMKEVLNFTAEKINSKLESMINDHSITPEIALETLTETYKDSISEYYAQRNNGVPTSVKMSKEMQENFKEMFKDEIPKDIMDRFEANKDRIERDESQKGDQGKGNDEPDGRD